MKPIRVQDASKSSHRGWITAFIGGDSHPTVVAVVCWDGGGISTEMLLSLSTIPADGAPYWQASRTKVLS